MQILPSVVSCIYAHSVCEATLVLKPVQPDYTGTHQRLFSPVGEQAVLLHLYQQ